LLLLDLAEFPEKLLIAKVVYVLQEEDLEVIFSRFGKVIS